MSVFCFLAIAGCSQHADVTETEAGLSERADELDVAPEAQPFALPAGCSLRVSLDKYGGLVMSDAVVECSSRHYLVVHSYLQRSGGSQLDKKKTCYDSKYCAVTNSSDYIKGSWSTLGTAVDDSHNAASKLLTKKL
jgi:hypothetical protein